MGEGGILQSLALPATLHCTDNHVLGELGRGEVVSPRSSEPVTRHLKPSNEEKCVCFSAKPKVAVGEFH